MKKKILITLTLVLVFFMCLYFTKLNHSFSIYRNNLSTEIYLTVLNSNNSLKVEFDSQDGNEIKPYYRAYNEEIGVLPIPIRDGYNFVGWYERPDGDDGKITTDTLVTENVKYYAHWIKIVCKKATTLHTETCQSNGSCVNYGHVDDPTITYGNLPSDDSPLLGDAYDCDVNDDGIFDSATERFYYIREELAEKSTAVLVHYTSFDENGQMNNSNTRGSYAYDTAKTYLPSTELWDNEGLVTFNNKAARFITKTDLEAACGTFVVDNSEYLRPCQFFLETTVFQSSTLGRTGIWIEKNGNNYYRIHSKNRNVNSVENTSKNTARPVIEVLYTAMDGFKEVVSHSVNFDSQGGTRIHSITRYEGQAVGELPVPEKEGFRFVGWYTDTTYRIQATPQTIIMENVTFHAKWVHLTDNFVYLFHIPGTCTFNGSKANITSASNDCISTINPTGNSIDYTATPNKYINTQVSLYNTTNYEKDFEIGFTIDEYENANNTETQVTLMSEKLENEEEYYPGLVFRRNAPSKFEVAHKINNTENKKLAPFNDPITPDNPIDVVIERRGGVISYSFNGGNLISVQTIPGKDYFNMPTWFGAASDSASREATTAASKRHLKGTLSNLYIKISPDNTIKYTVTFNTHGGSADFIEKEVNQGNPLGLLPTANLPGMYFDGWYTEENGGTKINENTVINGDIEYHAHYKNIYYVTFDGGDGEVSISPNAIEVVDGESIGANNLPTASQTGYVFDGWYTQNNVKITGTETISSDITYHAHYKRKYTVTFDGDGGVVSISPNTMEIAEGETIGTDNLPTATKEGQVFDGWYIDGDIRISGTEPINEDITYHARYVSSCRVTFDGNGGTPSIDSKDIVYGNPLGELPTATHTDLLLELDGWYSDLNDLTTKANENTMITGNITYHARWVTTTKVAIIGTTRYDTLQDAVTAVSTNGTKTTITLLKNTSENVTVEGGRNIYIDLNNHTVSNTTVSTQVFTVQSSVAANPTTLELENGTVTSSQGSGMINVNANGILKVGNNAILRATGTRQAIYIDGGKTYIYDGATITGASTQRAVVHNKTKGTLVITGGTITSTGLYAIYNENGTVEIGTKDGNVDTTKPTISGKTYGIAANNSVKFYDGIIQGKTAPIGTTSNTGNTPTVSTDANESKISEMEENTEKAKDTVDGYNRLYLQEASTQYKITLDLRGGSVGNNINTIIMVEPGEKVGALPTPTKGIYTFDGWYDEDTNLEVDDNTIPTKSTTYYVNWIYQVNPNVVEFRTTPDAQKVYYQNIETWKLDETNFPEWNYDTSNPPIMVQNFNTYNCMCADGQCSTSGTVNCDKPKGYNTGVNDQVNVYLYDTSTSTKGSQVTYAKGTNGIIYNLIPEQVYYWELASDTSVHGLIKFISERRLIDAGDVLNVRDLGGLPVDIDNDGVIDGNLKYGRLFRGIKLNSSASITELNNLGVTKELDLREPNSDAYRLSNYQNIQIQNYYINPDTTSDQELQYYNWTRSAVKQVMLDIIDQDNPQNIYFHCRIGTDRTGTLAYILEGLLGVPEEERVQDYELSFFYGLVKIHRYHDEKPGSSVGTGKERFVYMHNFMPSNTDIYNWYMAGTTQEEEANDIKLIQKFRKKMIDYINPGPEPNFATDSWDTIIENVRDDRSSYKVGDTKTIEMDLNSDGINETYTLRVANNTTPAECKTEGFSQTACGFVIEFTELITTHRMNPAVSGTTIGTGSYGGWENSDMRAFINSTKYLENTANEIDYSTTGIYNKLPSALKTGIIDTTVISGYGQGEEEHGNYTTIDKLYLLDPKELYGNSPMGYLSSRNNERQLDYYSELGVSTTNYQGALKKKVSTNTNDYWWLRSPLTDFNNSFHGAGQSSGWVQRKSQNVFGVSPAFRIAE